MTTETSLSGLAPSASPATAGSHYPDDVAQLTRCIDHVAGVLRG